MGLFQIIVFPGFLFLGLLGLVFEYVDRIVHARLQNRQGPPYFQPLADFIKLAAKEEIIPEAANAMMFKFMPILAVTGTVTSFLYIPLWNGQALFSFQGDLIVVLYLLTLPSLAFFLGGWFSTSLYAMVGAMRSLTQLFAYEVPLFLALLAPALLADTWSLSEMTKFYNLHPAFILVNIIGFGVALVTLLGKLEKVPFDMAEAETELAGGTFVEYSGRLLALFRMGIDMEVVVGASLLAAVFLPFGLELPAFFGFILYLLKISAIILILTLLRTLMARLRIDQMVEFSWKYLAPLAFLQVIISLIAKGVLL